MCIIPAALNILPTVTCILLCILHSVAVHMQCRLGTGIHVGHALATYTLEEALKRTREALLEKEGNGEHEKGLESAIVTDTDVDTARVVDITWESIIEEAITSTRIAFPVNCSPLILILTLAIPVDSLYPLANSAL